MLKLYFVKDGYDEWGVVVAANSARQAKPLGYKAIKHLAEETEYIDIKASLIKGLFAASNITEPTVFESCDGNEEWLCNAWGYSPDYCDECKLGAQKRAKWGFVEDPQ